MTCQAQGVVQGVVAARTFEDDVRAPFQDWFADGRAVHAGPEFLAQRFIQGDAPCAGDYVRAQRAGCFFLKRIASHRDDAVVVAQRPHRGDDHEADDAAADDEQRLTGLGRVPQHGVERAGERLHQDRIFIAYVIGNRDELGAVGDEIRAPAAARVPARADDEARREAAGRKVAALADVAPLARFAEGLHAPRLARQHGIDDDSLAYVPPVHVAPQRVDGAHVFVAQGEGEGREGNDGGGIAQSDDVQVASAYAAQPHFDAGPVFAGPAVGGIVVQVPGEALSEGRIGDVVTVRNLTSGNVVYGTLDEDGIVWVSVW